MRSVRLVKTAIQLEHHISTKKSSQFIGKWLAKELQPLGPLPLKMGQWASNRADVFGDAFVQELAVLRDDVSPMCLGDVQKVLKSVSEPGLVVEPNPIASASIGQVHVGTLKGKKVAVKLRRTNVLDDLLRDSTLLGLAVSILKALKTPDAEDAGHLLSELLTTFVRETDFLEEAKTMHEFPDVPGVVVPRPYMELCTDEIIVMDYVPSVPLETFAKTLDAPQRRRLATTLMQTFMHQLMESPVVHADPHPGNYGFDTKGNIVLYDFGNVVRMDADFQYALKLFTLAMISRNVTEAIRILQDDMHLKIIDAKQLEQWLRAYFEYVRTPGLDAKKSFANVKDIKKQPVIFTPDLVRLSRAFSALEGACTRISPGFNYYQLVESFADSVILNQQFMERKASEDLKKWLGRW